jgi:hypothetical protein
MTTRKVADLDAQIAQAERDYDAAQNRYRHRPRGTLMMGGPNAPVRIDRAARANMLDLGLEVQAAAIRRDQLKKQRAEVMLADLMDADAMAAEAAAVEAAADVLREAEAAAIAARTAFQAARGAAKSRADRIKATQAEIARAEGAIRSTQAVQAKEQAQRDELAPFVPSQASGRVPARASQGS